MAQAPRRPQPDPAQSLRRRRGDPAGIAGGRGPDQRRRCRDQSPGNRRPKPQADRSRPAVFRRGAPQDRGRRRTGARHEVPAPIRPEAQRAKNQPKPAAPADAPQAAETPESAPTAASPGKAEKKQKAAKPTCKSDQPAPNASNSSDSP